MLHPAMQPESGPSLEIVAVALRAGRDTVRVEDLGSLLGFSRYGFQRLFLGFPESLLYQFTTSK
jgi:hypothetical protein